MGHPTLNAVVALEVVMINPRRFYGANAVQNMSNGFDSVDDTVYRLMNTYSYSGNTFFRTLRMIRTVTTRVLNVLTNRYFF